MPGLFTAAERVLKTHPACLVFICMVGAGIVSWSYQVFAQQEDVDRTTHSLEVRMESLERRVESGFLGIEIAALEREVYQLETLQESGDARQRDIERLLVVRRDLRTARARLERVTE